MRKVCFLLWLTVFSPLAGVWIKPSRTSRMREKRADFVAGCLGGRVIAAGGLGQYVHYLAPLCSFLSIKYRSVLLSNRDGRDGTKTLFILQAVATQIKSTAHSGLQAFEPVPRPLHPEQYIVEDESVGFSIALLIPTSPPPPLQQPFPSFRMYSCVIGGRYLLKPEKIHQYHPFCNTL